MRFVPPYKCSYKRTNIFHHHNQTMERSKIVYHIWKSCIQPLEKSNIWHKFGDFLAPKLIQHVIAIGSIKILIQAHIFSINLVNFLAPKLIQHVIAIGSIKILIQTCIFAINLVTFLAPKLIQHVIAIGSIKIMLIFLP